MVADGKSYRGSYDKRASSMSVNIKGRECKGNYMLDSARSLGSGFAASGTTTVVGLGGGTTQSSNARATLVSADNQVLRCQFRGRQE